jgi:hypothetical protein
VSGPQRNCSQAGQRAKELGGLVGQSSGVGGLGPVFSMSGSRQVFSKKGSPGA